MANFYAESDDRKPLVLGIGASSYHTEPRDWSREIEMEIDWKPMDNLMISFNPEIEWARDFNQWVGKFEDNSATLTSGYRYVFADMKYTELSSSIRVNWTFSPKLSLQLYVQPLISTGDYSRFK